VIYITGDLHGEIGIHKLNMRNFPQQKSLTKNDYLIILGDFGLIWNNDVEEKYWQNWLNNKNFTTLFIDGNHENFDLLNSMPEVEYMGGKAHQIKENIYHLMRGEIYIIEENKFFTFGGAMSTDKRDRKEYISWWKQEIPNWSEVENGFVNLEKNNWTVDYVLTHDAPNKAIYSLNTTLYQDEVKAILNNFEEKIHCGKWYFGHHHIDKTIDNKYISVYNDIIKPQ